MDWAGGAFAGGRVKFVQSAHFGTFGIRTNCGLLRQMLFSFTCKWSWFHHNICHNLDTSRLSWCVAKGCRNPHFGTFGIRTNSAFHDYHVESTNSAFRIKFRFRTCAILSNLNQIRNFYNFMVETWFHHNICHHLIHQKYFKISFLAFIESIVTCSLERRFERGRTFLITFIVIETWFHHLSYLSSSDTPKISFGFGKYPS